jgi:hypothetical protein
MNLSLFFTVCRPKQFVDGGLCVAAVFMNLCVSAQPSIIVQANLKNSVYHSAYSKYAEVIISSEQNQPALDFWDARTRLRMQSLKFGSPFVNIISDSSGRYFAAGTASGIIYIINAATQEIRDSINVGIALDSNRSINFFNLPMIFLDTNRLIIEEKQITTNWANALSIGQVLVPANMQAISRLNIISIPDHGRITLVEKKYDWHILSILPEVGSKLLIVSDSARICTLDLQKGQISLPVRLKGMDLDNFHTIDHAYSYHDGELCVLKDENFYNFDLKSGHLIRKIDSVMSLAEIKPGLCLYQSVRNKKFHSYDMSADIDHLLPVKSQQMEYYTNISGMGHNVYCLFGQTGISLLNIQIGTVSSPDNFNFPTPLGICSTIDGCFLYGSENKLFEFDYIHAKMKRLVCELEEPIYKACYISSKELIIILTYGDNNALYAIDYTNSAIVWKRRLAGSVTEMTVSSNDSKLLVIQNKLQDAILMEFSTDSGQLLNRWENRGALYGADYVSSDEYIIGLYLDPYILSSGISNYQLKLYNSHVKSAITYSSFSYPSYQPIRVFTVSHDKSHIGMAFPEGEEALLIPLLPDSEFHKVLGNVCEIKFSRNDSMLAIGSMTHGNVSVFRYPSLKKIFEQQCGKGRVADLEFSDDGQKLYASIEDGYISVIDLAKGLITANAYLNEGNFILVDSGGYYTANKSQIRKIAIRENEYCHPISDLDIKYNRPDIVEGELGLQDSTMLKTIHLAYKKRLEKLHLNWRTIENTDIFPLSTIVNSQFIQSRADSDHIRIPMHFNSYEGYLSAVNVWVNKVPLYGIRGIDISQLRLSQLDTALEIPLANGENNIAIGCVDDRGVPGAQDKIQINYEPGQSSPGRVWFIGIGVSHYFESGKDLDYAAKDIHDLDSAFKSRYKNLLFDSLLIDTMVNRQTIDALKKWVAKSGINDKVILAVSGHGLLNDSLDFYLAPYGMDFKRPERYGISYAELESVLDSIPARQKLFLIDACHSGEVDKDELMELTSQMKTDPAGAVRYAKNELLKNHNVGLGLKNSFEYMEDLFENLTRTNGTLVIAAARGKQFANEGRQWGNGAFTYSVLDVFRTVGSKTLDISELRDRVAAKVQALTHGRQNPTSSEDFIENDWPIW